MWNDTQSCDDFKEKKVDKWDGNDCINFATAVLKELNIPDGIWLNKDAFQFMVGKDICTYKGKDYVNILGEEYGRKFYQAAKMYLKSRKCKGKSKNKIVNAAPIGYSYECNNWTVPQSQLSFDEIDSNQCLSPLLYSPASENCMNPALEEAYDYSYQNYNGLNSFTEMVAPEENLNELDELGGYSGINSLHCGSSEIFDDSGNISNFSLHDQYSGQMHSTGFCEQSNLNYLDNQPHEGCLSTYHGSATGASSSFDDKDFNNKELESLMEHFNIESSDFNFETFSEFDKYMPSPNPPPSYVSPLDNQSYSNVGAVEYDSGGTPSLLKQNHLEKIVTGKRKNRTRNPKSWEFLVRLLIDPQTNPSLIKWEDKEKGTFRLVNKDEIARLWGSRTSKHKDEALSYENFARIMRYHYKSSGMLKAVSEKHLVYQLGEAVIHNLKEKNIL